MSNCKVIALTNQKGGVGKTTTAVNLGVGLAKQGKRVLLIDADAQANLTMALGYSRPDDLPITLSTIMQNIIDDKSFDVSQGILSHNEGVDLLPSNIELSGFEVRLINAMSRERVLKTYVNEVKKNYDYVLIDCMPSLGMITINALAAADSVVIPTQPHYLSAKGLELLLRSVSMRLYSTIVLRFAKEISYRVYDEFDNTQISTEENGDLIVSVEMPEDEWLIGYLLSFGTQVDIVEPAHLKDIVAKQAKSIYEKYKS